MHWVLSAAWRILFVAPGIQSARARWLPHKLSCPSACRILVPLPGMEPVCSASEGRFSRESQEFSEFSRISEFSKESGTDTHCTAKEIPMLIFKNIYMVSLDSGRGRDNHPCLFNCFWTKNDHWILKEVRIRRKEKKNTVFHEHKWLYIAF